jgi:ATP-dependent Clp protease ATP-binding subunit ClpB
VKQSFRPEFLNRVDDIILFHRLMRQHMGAIVDIQLRRLDQLLRERKITVEVSDEAKLLLGEKGYDAAYGARPLKRVIQKLIQDPLAEEILSGRVNDGDKVEIGAKAGVLVFNGAVPGSLKAVATGAVKTVH